MLSLFSFVSCFEKIDVILKFYFILKIELAIGRSSPIENVPFIYQGWISKVCRELQPLFCPTPSAFQ